MNKKYSIGQVAEMLGVNIMTLRRWEKSGQIISERTTGGHRYYQENNIKNYLQNLDVFKLATQFIKSTKPEEPLKSFYCQNNDIFRARLGKFEADLQKSLNFHEIYSLIVAITGEIGNNSFDHNLGNWPDSPGIFFGYNLKNKQIALADRGQGILKTLKKVKPDLKNNLEALETAFTEIISGRAPEARGNGLKFVKNVIIKYNTELFFQTGNAQLKLKRGDKKLKFRQIKNSINGCLALIKYNY